MTVTLSGKFSLEMISAWVIALPTSTFTTPVIDAWM